MVVTGLLPVIHCVLNGEESDDVVVDWKSFRLPRVSRSSLHCESQAASAARDAVEYVKCVWALMRLSDADPMDNPPCISATSL